LYIEASQKRKGSFSVLKSTSTTFGAGAWLSFQYHMYGARIGTLEVMFAEGPRKQTSLWKKTSNKGNKWHLADIDLSSIAGKTGEIWLAATLVKTCAQYLGDTAIDELSLTTGTGSATAAPIGTENNKPKPTPAPSATPFDRIDSDNSGTIKRAEWDKAIGDGILKAGTTVAPAGTTVAPALASAVFKRIDLDNSGNLHRDELKKAIASGSVTVNK
jgi:hypothetical protein